MWERHIQILPVIMTLTWGLPKKISILSHHFSPLLVHSLLLFVFWHPLQPFLLGLRHTESAHHFLSNQSHPPCHTQLPSTSVSPQTLPDSHSCHFHLRSSWAPFLIKGEGELCPQFKDCSLQKAWSWLRCHSIKDIVFSHLGMKCVDHIAKKVPHTQPGSSPISSIERNILQSPRSHWLSLPHQGHWDTSLQLS